MVEIIKIALAKIAFWFGYYWFRIFSNTPKYSYLSLRKLFYTSNTAFNKALSAKIALRNPPYTSIQSNGVLGNLLPDDINRIGSEIQRNGYYVFEKTLDDSTIDELLQFSLTTKAKLMPKSPNSNEYDFFDRTNVKTIKYQFQEEDLIRSHAIQKLISDRSIIAVAQSFLQTKPILDMISMWWSTSFSKKASSEVAQLYHFDMERIKFLKFFFYLTDVDSETGPHCYIRGSNNGFPKALQKDGRIEDEEILKAYKGEDILEIVGKRGTILAVDTSGFHKGKNLSKDDRLLLQFEFTNSLFGVKNTFFNIPNPSRNLVQAMHEFPEVYKRYTTQISQ